MAGSGRLPSCTLVLLLLLPCCAVGSAAGPDTTTPTTIIATPAPQFAEAAAAAAAKAAVPVDGEQGAPPRQPGPPDPPPTPQTPGEDGSAPAAGDSGIAPGTTTAGNGGAVAAEGAEAAKHDASDPAGQQEADTSGDGAAPGTTIHTQVDEALQHNVVPEDMTFAQWRETLRDHEDVVLNVPSHISLSSDHNYASVDCGARVIAANQGAQNMATVLNRHRDQYMLNPCSNDGMWVVVELCDDIVVTTVKVGNFELFSSMFNNTRLSVSDRYPAKRWLQLGDFQAEDTREEQAFEIKEPQIFAKYLKINFTSYVGNEFYCPLSLLEVYGITMLDEYKYLKTLEGLHEAGLTGEMEVEAEAPKTGEASGSQEATPTGLLGMFKTALTTVFGLDAGKSADVAGDTNASEAGAEAPGSANLVTLLEPDPDAEDAAAADSAPSTTAQLVTVLPGETDDATPQPQPHEPFCAFEPLARGPRVCAHEEGPRAGEDGEGPAVLRLVAAALSDLSDAVRGADPVAADDAAADSDSNDSNDTNDNDTTTTTTTSTAGSAGSSDGGTPTPTPTTTTAPAAEQVSSKPDSLTPPDGVPDDADGQQQASASEPPGQHATAPDSRPAPAAGAEEASAGAAAVPPPPLADTPPPTGSAGAAVVASAASTDPTSSSPPAGGVAPVAADGGPPPPRPPPVSEGEQAEQAAGSETTAAATGAPSVGQAGSGVATPAIKGAESIFSQLRKQIHVLNRNLTLSTNYLETLSARFVLINSTVQTDVPALQQLVREMRADLTRMREGEDGQAELLVAHHAMLLRLEGFARNVSLSLDWSASAVGAVSAALAVLRDLLLCAQAAAVLWFAWHQWQAQHNGWPSPLLRLGGGRGGGGVRLSSATSDPTPLSVFGSDVGNGCGGGDDDGAVGSSKASSRQSSAPGTLERPNTVPHRPRQRRSSVKQSRSPSPGDPSIRPELFPETDVVSALIRQQVSWPDASAGGKVSKRRTKGKSSQRKSKRSRGSSGGSPAIPDLDDAGQPFSPVLRRKSMGTPRLQSPARQMHVGRSASMATPSHTPGAEPVRNGRSSSFSFGILSSNAHV